MKILLLCGSPRKNGNTARILKTVASELSIINTVEVCYITDYKINGCVGCNTCQSILNQPGCTQKDDASTILNKIIDADVVLYGTPLYGHSYSGQLKILMDRHVALFKFVDGGEKAVDEMEILSFIKDKPVGLIVSCQGPEEKNAELVQMQFERFCESSLARCMGKYIFPWCSPNAVESEYSWENIKRIVSDIEEQKI